MLYYGDDLIYKGGASSCTFLRCRPPTGGCGATVSGWSGAEPDLCPQRIRQVHLVQLHPHHAVWSATRQSGPLADKNRFAPWTGEAMQGRMDLETGGQRWTVLRDTRRASAPMQNFACTYTGTAQSVPEVNGQNLGETLLGVPREVFQRSAFIGQSGLAVSQDPELERRIAALLSTGQEDVSYSESYDRLKKQLNRRRHNKTADPPAGTGAGQARSSPCRGSEGPQNAPQQQ